MKYGHEFPKMFALKYTQLLVLFICSVLCFNWLEQGFESQCLSCSQSQGALVSLSSSLSQLAHVKLMALKTNEQTQPWCS